MKQIGVALIGCGAISGVHLRAISEIPTAKLIAVVDTNENLAKATAESYGCAYYTDYVDMLANPDVDVVHITTAHYQHAPMAIDALKAGKHVLTEKPMAESKAAAQSMLQAAETYSQVQLGVIFQNRYNPASRLMKKAVESSELGKLLCLKGIVTWNRTAAYYETAWKGKWATEGGGALINQSIHTLDLLQWLGGEVSSVKGTMSNDSLEDVIEVEDTVHVHLTYKNGATAVFYATNAYGVNSPPEIELVFEKGKLVMIGDTLYQVIDDVQTLLSSPEANNLGAKSYWGISHSKQIADFYEHLLTMRPYWLNGPEGYKAFELVMDIYESSRTGKRITYR
ncbi:Gfo/Idh/MocA family protein [Paenibacillus roseipurpureus]|uniref:Gfo/Idh/MocA family oxidoreductase n=1 Tax=Paenibacillus roseopurpureus TaxID=2918901 RepID=A0AA96RGD9_9BACL|nr:Gfo/Idh/MocA family oxidoreductase [Paenibacillus sp. MBLB1832]WNR42078.1 Gfo/Idh/MocA family oxidoreductase [Paenibacillus sp. MBLB1832]